MKLSQRFLTLFLFISLTFAYPCTTKVSEWTMLNFLPSFYELVYFTETTSNKHIIDDQKKIKQAVKDVNLKFYIVNINQFKDEKEKMMFEMSKKAKLPFYALFYNGQLFAHFNSANELLYSLQSPLLATIADELKNGKLCVLIQLNKGDQTQNTQSADVLDKYLSSSILKSIIPVIFLDPDKSQDRMFINILLNIESDLANIKEPMLFGIFGRFRILEPLVGKGITAENIDYLVKFLSADCSCIIKAQMPGIDMLYYNKWNNVKPALLNQIITE